jgi:tetratricopeptide (TPR) repeat protein
VEHFDAKRYDEAIRSYNESLRLWPSNRTALRNLEDALGWKAHELGDYGSAVEHWRQVLRYDPDDTATAENIAIAEKLREQEPWWKKAKNCGECGEYLHAALGSVQRRIARATPEALYIHYQQSMIYYRRCDERFGNQCETVDPRGWNVYSMTKGCSSWNPANHPDPEVAANNLEACLSPWAD